MIDLLFELFATPADYELLIALVVIAAVLGLCWWDFYAKPCRDSLRNIERALLAAPWMRSQPQSGVRRSA